MDVRHLGKVWVGGVVLSTKNRFGVGWAGTVKRLVEGPWAGRAIGASDGGVGGLRATKAGLDSALVVCGEMRFGAHPTLGRGLTAFQGVPEGLAKKGLRWSIGSGFLPAAPAVKQGDGGRPNVANIL